MIGIETFEYGDFRSCRRINLIDYIYRTLLYNQFEIKSGTLPAYWKTNWHFKTTLFWVNFLVCWRMQRCQVKIVFI